MIDQWLKECHFTQKECMMGKEKSMLSKKYICKCNQSTFQNTGLQGIQGQQGYALAGDTGQSFLGMKNEKPKSWAQKGAKLYE